MKPCVGQLYVTQVALLDSDDEGQDRITPSGSIGRLVGLNNGDVWDMAFDNGAWQCPTEDDLQDPAQFRELL